jgi:uncharacterized protein (TIGR03435 family)
MRTICGLFLFAGSLLGQFEVASVKQSAPGGDMRGKIGLHIDGAQVRFTYVSMNDLIRIAYRVKNYNIVGPDWLLSDRYDISAKLPEGGTRAQVPEMLRAMLEDRFQLKVHRDTKEFPVFGLMVAKGGLKMKEEEAADASAPVEVAVTGDNSSTTVSLGGGASITLGETKLECAKVTMPQLADQLARFVDRPIVDMTELKGRYTFSLSFDRQDFIAMKIRTALSAGIEMPAGALRLIEQSSDGALMTALQAAGLKLESRKAPLEVVVVDKVMKVPTEN